MADPTQIHQIMMNLCINAYQAMRETGGVLAIGLHEVEVRADDYLAGLYLAPGRYVVLDVSDTGPGIRPEVKNRIFEPYFTTKDKGGGYGHGAGRGPWHRQKPPWAYLCLQRSGQGDHLPRLSAMCGHGVE